MSEYQKLSSNATTPPLTTRPEAVKPEKIPSSLRGVILRTETEIDATIGRLLGLIERLEPESRIYDEEFMKDKQEASTVLNKVEEKIAEVGLILHISVK